MHGNSYDRSTFPSESHADTGRASTVVGDPVMAGHSFTAYTPPETPPADDDDASIFDAIRAVPEKLGRVSRAVAETLEDVGQFGGGAGAGA